MKFLIVDDSRAMRMIVKSTLRKAGYKVDTVEADNGVNALKELDANPDVKLVLTDWNMPEMGGHGLCQALQSRGFDGVWGVVSSAVTPDMKDAATSAGATFILTKPFTPGGFREALEAAGFAAEGACDTAFQATNARASFDAVGVKTALSGMIRRPIDVKPTRRPMELRRLKSKVITAVYTQPGSDDAGVVICDLALAVNLAAALSLMPAGTVKDAAKTGRVPPNIKDNLNEVFNLLCRTIGGELTVQVKEVDIAPKQLDMQIRAAARAGKRIDMNVSVQGYADGPMCMIRYPVAVQAALKKAS